MRCLTANCTPVKPKTMPRLNEDEKRVIWKYRYEKSATQIAQMIGRTPATVINYLRKNGVTVRTNKRQ